MNRQDKITQAKVYVFTRDYLTHKGFLRGTKNPQDYIELKDRPAIASKTIPDNDPEFLKRLKVLLKR